MRVYYTWKTGRLREVKGEVVREQPLTVFVNGEKFITLLCTPAKLDCLVVGYLWLEEGVASADAPRRARPPRAPPPRPRPPALHGGGRGPPQRGGQGGRPGAAGAPEHRGPHPAQPRPHLVGDAAQGGPPGGPPGRLAPPAAP